MGVKMKKELGVLIFVTIIAFASMGTSFAGDKHTAFVQSYAWDEEEFKDVGYVSAYISQTGELIVTVSDAYPGYVAFVSFTIQNIGIPNEDPGMYLISIGPINGNTSKLDVAVTDPSGNQIPINTYLDPGDTLDGLLTITALPGAEQDASYSFGANIVFDSIPA